MLGMIPTLQGLAAGLDLGSYLVDQLRRDTSIYQHTTKTFKITWLGNQGHVLCGRGLFTQQQDHLTEGVGQFLHNTRLVDDLPPPQGLDASSTIKHSLSPKMEELRFVPIFFSVTR